MLLAHMLFARRCIIRAMPGSNLEDRQGLLARTALFGTLEAADLAEIAALATTRRLAAREELFHKGAEGSQLYVVISGRLKVITTSNEGDDLMFCVAGPGEVIGDISVLVDRPRTATVAALEKTELIVIDRRDFHGLLRRRPDVSVELLRILARRVARLSEFLEDTHFDNLPVRLAKKLTDFASLHGRTRPADAHNEILIDLKLSQEEWGDLVGATRESVNKQFRTWSEEGLIALEQGRVVVRKLEELEKLADCVVL
jgi:CRP/FNR family cyclic AMP-dependent transcriptional regulator